MPLFVTVSSHFPYDDHRVTFPRAFTQLHHSISIEAWIRHRHQSF